MSARTRLFGGHVEAGGAVDAIAVHDGMAGMPNSVQRGKFSGMQAPSRKEKAERALSSMNIDLHGRDAGTPRKTKLGGISVIAAFHEPALGVAVET